MSTSKCIIVLRGHIRNSFETPALRNMMLRIINKNSNASICIHTWSTFANSISWRSVRENTTLVTIEIIREYFGEEIFRRCDRIIIDDDSLNKLHGRTKGTVLARGNMPIIGWKNYWCGKHRILQAITQMSNADGWDPVRIITCRFDVLNNSNSLTETAVETFIINELTGVSSISFAVGNTQYGVDNIYAGTLKVLNKLTNQFHFHMDDMLTDLGTNPATRHFMNHEFLVPVIGNSIADNIANVAGELI